MKIDYKILRSNKSGYLTDVVKEHLDDGWLPSGGVSYDSGKDIYIQAMIRYFTDTSYILVPESTSKEEFLSKMGLDDKYEYVYDRNEETNKS